MPTYEYPGYADDAALTQQILDRLERVSKAIEKLQQNWDDIVIEAVGGDGDVELTVNHKGQLISLSLAQGCTQRYTNLALEELITRTVQSAAAEAAAQFEAANEAANEAADALLDPEPA